MLVACYRRFGTTHQAHLQDRLPDETDLLPGNDGIQLATQATHHHKKAETSTGKRRRPQLDRDASLKSHIPYSVTLYSLISYAEESFILFM